MPLAIEVAAANRHDMKLVTATLAHMMCAQPDGRRKSKLCLDLGYDYEEVRQIVHIAGFEPVIVGRREEKRIRNSAAHVPDAGSLSAHIAGSTASVGYW